MIRAADGGGGLYVHVPFCEALCSYCDFYAVQRDHARESRYVEAIAEEARRRVPAAFAPRTVLVGGGTPTSLPDDDFARLFDLISSLVSPGCRVEEWTVEANPESLTPTKARIMRERGVTRLSIGVQSFDDALLRSIGRVHDADTAIDAVGIARDVGFDQVSIDLLFAVPGQSLDTFRRDLARAIELAVDHISAYALLCEEGTGLTRTPREGTTRREDPDIELTMLRLARSNLTDAGYAAYEISNFARDGCECRHSLNYWRNGEYHGLGPAAASYVSGLRRINVRSWREYEDTVLAGGDACAFEERLDPRAAMGEEVMLRLRLAEGLSLSALSERWGCSSRDVFSVLLDRFSGAGLLAWPGRGDRIALTERGLELADSVLAEFLAVPV